MVKEKLKKIKFLQKLYNNIKENKKIKGKYKFTNRMKGKENLCIILAGYKDFLWGEVFARIKMFCNENIDVCIVSSGIYNETLEQIAQKNNWSYLSTKDNKVTLAQNIAIEQFKKAKYIYKLDEDIIVCKDFFENLKNTYEKVVESGRYKVGFVAPLLPINGYGHIKILEKLDLLNDYETKFGRTYYSSSADNKIMVDVDTAKYMWNATYDIDKLAEEFSNDTFKYSACPCRFSIGAIYFSRETFEQMGKFQVDSTNGLGKDERQLCSYCVIESKVMIISENTLAGHFCFGPQNEEMKKMYMQNNMLKSINLAKR